MSLLAERAVLVRPEIRLRTFEILDRRAGEAAAGAFGADSSRLRATKRLVPKESIFPIEQAGGALRRWVKQETLPWRWDGVSLCPNTAYLPLMAGWRERRTLFEREVAAFVSQWDELAAEGRRALGTLAQDFDYPDAAEAARSFSASIDTFPVPDAADFRAALPESEAEAIRQSLRDYADAQLEEAERFLWSEMAEHVGHIQERLAAYGRDGDGKVVGRFTDSLIGNMRALCERLARLNVTGNSDIEAMRRRIIAGLCVHDPSELRSDEALRASVKDEATRIAEAMAQFYAPHSAAQEAAE